MIPRWRRIAVSTVVGLVAVASVEAYHDSSSTIAGALSGWMVGVLMLGWWWSE